MAKTQAEGKGLYVKKCCDLPFETLQCSVNEKVVV